MVLRQTRLIAALMLATILAIAAGSVLVLGWDGPFLVRRDTTGLPILTLSAGQAALKFGGAALLWSIVYDRAARLRRWRRNIVRAGGVFAMTWIGTLALLLAVQAIALAEAIGHPVGQHRAYAAAVGILVLLKANLLPKSRPAWFNGVIFPFIAADAEVWRRVHRSSAYRLGLIGAGTLLVACLGPPGADPLSLVVKLLLAELCLASLHALWLGNHPGPLALPLTDL